MAHLVIRNAEKWYRREDGSLMKVLNGLSFEVRDGQVTVLVGPSGCGKTTFMNVVVNVEPLDRGELVFIDDTGQPQPRPAIGYVFQSPRLLPWKRVGDNLRVALRGAQVPREEWDTRVHKYLDLVGLGDFVDQYPLYLSGGMRQRVGLARALAVETGIVLMDEPFASVDEMTARQLRETTRSLCEQLRRTVLFVTHNLFEAAYMSDYVVLLTPRPAQVQEYLMNPLPTPRVWSADVYEFATILESKIREGAEAIA